MPEPGFLVVGLGNPGSKYEHTYHNLGYLVVDRLAARNSIRVSRSECRARVGQGLIGSETVLLAQPQTFMNLSGQAVKGLVEKYQLPAARIVVVYDELDLPWGSLRIRPKGSAAGHNGMKDILCCLGTEEIARVRMGIHPGHPVEDAAEFVLAPMKGEQRKQLDELLDHASQAVESIIAWGAEKAMAEYNRRAPGANREEE
jgi:peptidyl-tRNA hydrolase, PTH1 family